MAVPNWFKLVVDEGFITDCIETEGRVLHSTFTTYLPIYSKETLNQMSPVYKDIFKKTKSNWMYFNITQLLRFLVFQQLRFFCYNVAAYKSTQ
jgi:hypothetical protein